jgi:hypothetical protein
VATSSAALGTAQDFMNYIAQSNRRDRRGQCLKVLGRAYGPSEWASINLIDQDIEETIRVFKRTASGLAESTTESYGSTYRAAVREYLNHVRAMRRGASTDSTPPTVNAPKLVERRDAVRSSQRQSKQLVVPLRGGLEALLRIPMPITTQEVDLLCSTLRLQLEDD